MGPYQPNQGTKPAARGPYQPWAQFATPNPYVGLSPQDFTAKAGSVTNPLDWKRLKAAWQSNPYRTQNPADWRNLQNTALYGNPIAAQADTETSQGHGGLLSRIKGAGRSTFGYDTRLAAAKIAAIFGGITAIAGGPVAAGAVGGSTSGAAATTGGLTASQAAAAGVDPFLAGGGLSAAAAPAVGGTLATTAPHWYNSFAGQTAISSGANLLGGVLQNRAQGKADKANRKAIEDRIRRALANLSPEHIMALAQQFMPQMAANMNQAGQTAIQAVREQAARTGQLESPRALSFEAGTRAKLAGDVQQQAFERAFNLAGNQAGVLTGMPVNQVQPQMGYAQALTDSVNQAYFARAMSQRQPQQQTGVPYAYPYNPYPPQSRGVIY